MGTHGFLSSLIPSYFHLWHIPVVFFGGMIAEAYAAVIGSGGVLIQFMLSALGMPLNSVIATDLAGCTGADIGIVITASSPRKIWKNKKLLLMLTMPFFLGGIVGTVFLVSISVAILKYILIGGLSLLLAHIFLGKKPVLRAIEELHIDLKHYPLVFTVLFVLGIYLNVSGVGAGTFLKLVFISLLRLSVLDSIGVGSLMYLLPGWFSFIVTAIAGLIVWPYCVTLWIGTFIGGKYAVKFARKIPENYLRGLLIGVVSLYLVWLLVSL